MSWEMLRRIFIPDRVEKEGQFMIKTVCQPDYKQSYQQDKQQTHKR